MTSPTNSSPLSRRDLLRASASIGAATIVAPHVLGGPNHVAPSDRINVALVGAGGRGRGNVKELLKLDDVRITAIADPAQHWNLDDFYYRSKAGRDKVGAEIEEHYRKNESDFSCQLFEDYREMIASSGDLFDAVLCATPDHVHANVSIDSMRAGKHIYCEKPLTNSVAEVRLVAQVAKETGMATQLGNQGHSENGIRETCELIWAGAIGTITEVHAWVPATRWNKTLQVPPTEVQEIPSGLNWDLWCGPRKPVGFHSVYAPVSWRDFWEFGCGSMGDFGCHDLDSATWALDLSPPDRIEMFPAGQSHPAMTPYGEIGYFDFDSAQIDGPGKPRGPVRIHWYSGGLQPSQPRVLGDQKLPRRGVLFVGTEGVMVCQGAGGNVEVFPKSRRDAVQRPEPSLKRSNGHHRDWIDAIKGGPAASSNFEYGAKLTEITLLGVVALRHGSMIQYDSEKMEVVNSKPANELLHGYYRDGWKLS